METKVKVFLGEKKETLNNVLSFINVEHVNPISIGSVILKDESLFMTVSYNGVPDSKTYSLKEVEVGNVSDTQELIVSEIENATIEENVVCHEMIVDGNGVISIIYLIED
jgi:hypothetical protein